MSCSFQSRTYTSFRRPLDINPIVKYDNADIDKVKIFADNRNKLGGIPLD